jgi:phage regulator Rha-like protein
MNKDLFPNTLLVSREGEHIYTTSLKVAEFFKKNHFHVLREIKHLISELSGSTPQNGGVDQTPLESDYPILDGQIEFSQLKNRWPLLESDCPKLDSQIEFSRRNFAPSDYVNARGKTYQMYKLTRDGFALLAMGFTGKVALQWKVEFLSAFREQERELARLTQRFASALDQVRPSLRPVVEGTEAGLARTAIGERLGKTVGSVSYHRHQARRFGLLPSLRPVVEGH